MFGCFMGSIQSFVHAIVLEKTWLQYVASRNLFPIWTLQHVYIHIYIYISWFKWKRRCLSTIIWHVYLLYISERTCCRVYLTEYPVWKMSGRNITLGYWVVNQWFNPSISGWAVCRGFHRNREKSEPRWVRSGQVFSEFRVSPCRLAAAGSLLVCKIAGAAARAGLSLEEAEGRGTGPGAAGGSKEAAFLQST